jgi:hypothetical protein
MGDRRYLFFGRDKSPQDPPQRPEGFGIVFGFWAPIGHPEEVHEMDLDKELKPLAMKLLPELLPLAAAAGQARRQPNPQGRPWNYSVFRERDGRITGYLLQSTNDPDEVPVGGDFRLTFSSDGLQILKKEEMHKSFLSLKPPKEAKQAAGGFHTHVLQDDLPPETDLATLRLYKGGVPHYLATSKWVWVLQADGHLHFLGSVDRLKTQK